MLLVDADKQASANLWAGIRRRGKVEPTVACVQKNGTVAGVLLNRTSTNRQVREADEVRELIATYPNLHLMQSLIRDRIVYRNRVRDGLSVVEYKPRDAHADAEIQSFYEEVFENG